MNIIITGASKGIGFEIAKKFCSLENHKIVAISRDNDRLQNLKVTCERNKNTSKIITIASDLNSILNDCSVLQGVIKNQFPQVDILINNAGLLINKPFDIIEEEDKNRIFNTNFFIPAKLIECILPFLNIPSHIVNIGSMGGYQGSSKFPGLSYYSASKAALASLTECLAEEYKEKSIFFNCLALGAVQTEMFKEAFQGYKAPLNAQEMAEFIVDFSLNGYKYFNGKILPVSISTP